jgi:hypothetical protein
MNLPFVLDVAIGLVFTYLILSLLASEVQELLATVMQWRAKHLKDSIENLLAGGTGSTDQDRVKDLVGRLYNDPLLKNINQEARGLIAGGFRRLSRLLPSNRAGAFGGHQATGPSYIASETFATSLLERLGINSMIDKLTDVRFDAFVSRIVGEYSKDEMDYLVIPSDADFARDWDRGNIRVIASKVNRYNLNEDPNFRLLVEDYDEIRQAYRMGQASLETCVERMGEGLDGFINACTNPDAQDAESRLYVRRLKSFKLNLFGEGNDRAMISGGLKPSLSEIAELVNQGSNVYKEVDNAYDRIANQARPIDKQVESSIQVQLDDYKVGLSEREASRIKTYADLPYDYQQIFVDNALKDLTAEERQLYEEYQSYKKIRSGISRLPDSVKESLSILARRAQTRTRRVEHGLNQFRDEIALWFDRSMSRASGVYRRNAKGVAILIGLMLAAGTNSDTFHIFNRLSSDDSLRRLVTERAAQIDLNSANSPRLSAQLEDLKNQTDTVLREIAFPISWNPSNLSRQLGCTPLPPAPPLGIGPAAPAPPRDQWNELYQSCLNTKEASTMPIPAQVVQIIVNRPLDFGRMLAGWVVSGIAIAMGAPFWFDLLGKLVNVRNSGGKPKSSADEKTSTN